MPAVRYRALVVDDELSIQRLVIGALIQQGFECDPAEDGKQAAQALAQSHYDAVVTDLRMPHRHGHALALDLLQQADRPVVVIHTGVVEPKLAKDLLARGVDDILFKPTDFGLLAAKVRAMVERRAPRRAQTAAPPKSKSPAAGDEAQHEPADGPVSLFRLNERLAEVGAVLPISKAALDVYNMTRSYDWELSQIGAAIQRDAALTTEVLRLANSSLYNPSGQRISRIDQAILRVGQRRVGELALTANALSAMTPETLPWMDLELAWKRSMSAGLVLEALVELGGHQQHEEGLMLSAIIYPLGRVVLGMLFPQQYDFMLQRQQASGETLQAQERRIFPTAHTEIMAHLLASWRIPPDVFLPLKFAPDDFATLARLSEPMRTRSELVKLAILLGRLAVDRWERWDLVQFPPAGTMERLGVADVGQVLRQIRSDLAKIAEFRPGEKSLVAPPTHEEPKREIPYCNLSGSRADLLAELLPAVGLEPVEHSAEDLAGVKGAAIVNGIGPAVTRLPIRGEATNVVVVTDADKSLLCSRFAKTATLPSSFGQLRDALTAPPAEPGVPIDALLASKP